MLKTATIVGRGHRSRTLLNLLTSSFHSPVFWKRSFTTPCYPSCFHFRSCPLIFDIFLVNYDISKRHWYRKTTSRVNKLLLGNLRTNRERVILPSSQSKSKKKNTLFVDLSAFSNFALYVIRPWLHETGTTQTGMIKFTWARSESMKWLHETGTRLQIGMNVYMKHAGSSQLSLIILSLHERVPSATAFWKLDRSFFTLAFIL